MVRQIFIATVKDFENKTAFESFLDSPETNLVKTYLDCYNSDIIFTVPAD